MKKIALFLFAFLACALMLSADETVETATAIEAAAAAPHSVEVAIVQEPRAPEYREKTFQRNVKQVKLPCEFIDADLLARPAELAKYKRVVIFGTPMAFSEAALDGIQKYVEEGGLFISDTIFFGIDTNGDFKMDFSLIDPMGKRPADHPRRKEFPPTGVRASGNALVKSVTAVVECPLSQGFSLKEEKPVEFNFRYVKEAGATVILRCAAAYKGQESVEKGLPLVAIRNAGKGAYLFTPMIEPFLDNAMSAETLDWLTAGEE